MGLFGRKRKDLAYVSRPFGTALGGAVGSVAIGLLFVIAGTIKTAYDLTLWAWFRGVRLPAPEARP